jgi:hypothetical protein
MQISSDRREFLKSIGQAATVGARVHLRFRQVFAAVDKPYLSLLEPF